MFGFYKALPFVFVFVFYGITTVHGQSSTPTPASTPCASKSNTSCDECLQNVKCLWCGTTKQCVDYPVGTILPSRSLCPLAEARWGLCWVNFQTLIISMSVLAGVLIIAILVCCCCKCERTGRNKREDAKAEQQAQDRKSRHEERKTEMKLRHEEIRQKYGLTKGSPYSRMEEN